MTMKLSTDHRVMVGDYTMINAKDSTPPKGALVLCGSVKSGTTVIGYFDPSYHDCWFPLPRHPKPKPKDRYVNSAAPDGDLETLKPKKGVSDLLAGYDDSLRAAARLARKTEVHVHECRHIKDEHGGCGAVSIGSSLHGGIKHEERSLVND